MSHPGSEKPERDNQIVDMYVNTKINIRDIAGMLGMTFQRVHQILKRAKVEMRPRHHRNKKPVDINTNGK